MENSQQSPGPYVLPLADARDAQIVGGKAINLGKLINAGFPVPDGFVVTTYAFQRGVQALPADVAEAAATAYRAIGSPTVAVRSSATAEDLADASMAGQYETYLDIQGEQDVIDAVARCWQSIDSPRIHAYLAEHDIPVDKVAMAVVVQRLIPAEKAGVLFTANPRTGSQNEILVEANWGLGETVVSGTAQPDTLVLDRATGALKTCVIADKQVWLEPGSHETRPVPEDKRKATCLNSREVLALWKLGLKVMDHFDAPQDIEWAIADGELFLLQSRTVTTLEDAELYEQLLSDIRVQLRDAKNAGRGDWVRHNIGETLPHPTPLTWSVIRRFMSGDGGFGQMYKQVGFEPSPAVCREGFLDLVGGQIYMDLSRGPDMFFKDFPFEYDLDLMRTDPDAAQGPPTIPAGSLLDRFRIGRKLNKPIARLRELAKTFDAELTDRIIPAFERYVTEEKARDLTALTTAEWLELWAARKQAVLDEFAPRSLMPSLIVAMAIEDLRTFVREQFWDADPDALTNLLSATGEPDLTVAANQGLCDVAEGKISVEDWLKTNGHRAPEEFDLASPRWREQPGLVAKMAEHLKDSTPPLTRHEQRAEQADRKIAELSASLSPTFKAEFQAHLAMVGRYMRFREDGKHYLMLGYDLLRDILLEAGRRLEITDDVFLLSIEELRDALRTGIAPLHLIEKRRELRMAERRLTLSEVITAADLDSLGEPPVVEGSNSLEAFSLSGGTCRGPVRVVMTPAEAGDMGKDYVLVCPSTDPSWTPLFAGACGVVLERGGTLSHGAVVAREMGVPAVVLPGATRLLANGEEITVDANRGMVLRASADDEAATDKPDPGNTRIAPEKVPPISGPAERRGAKIRNVFLAIWAIFFLAFAFAPTAMEDASNRVLDIVLLPLKHALGRPVITAIIAGLFAMLTMVLQRLLTDNGRLRTAKKRAAALTKEAKTLPKDSPRHKALTALAAPVQTRVTLAAFVPLAVLLGPMILSFLWLPQRVDTAVQNAKPGSMVEVTAVVSGDANIPVQLTTDEPLKLADEYKPTQRIFLARPWLKKYLNRLEETESDLSAMPWDLAQTLRHNRNVYKRELDEFLDGSMPDQNLSWAVTTPKDQPGRWPITLTAGQQEITVFAVLGDRYAPEYKEDVTVRKGRRTAIDRQVQLWRSDDPNAPVREVQLRYGDANRVQGENTFWKPLDWLEGNPLFTPWLVLYIVVYVVIMFSAKFTLRVA